ncbi:MAG TPA: DUF3592 domain-containing protein [Mycobacteriales bacterium]|nr:DUF3592 domain-containing protein [Mycobacteriales bacterium]
MRQRPPTPKWVSALLVLGVVLIALLPVALIGAGLHIRGQVTPIKGGSRATGTIVGVSSEDEIHGKSFTPTIAFTDSRGHVHLFDGPSDATAQKVGTKVVVSYDPADPDHATDVSAGTTGWKATFWTGVGLGVVEVGLIGWVIRRRVKVRGARSGPDVT